MLYGTIRCRLDANLKIDPAERRTQFDPYVLIGFIAVDFPGPIGKQPMQAGSVFPVEIGIC
jgi:hypothetical protein